MDKIIRYLDIIKFEKFRYKQIKKSSFLCYCLLGLRSFYKKMNKTKIIFKKKFLTEIKEVMFGYGDSRTPNKEVIKFIENSIIKFVSIIVVKVNFVSFLRLSRRPVFEDILFIIRKNPCKTKRIIYLIRMKEIIEKLVKQTKNSNQIPRELISKCKNSI